MKVSELTGAQLDLWVHRAERSENREVPRYSADWGIAGPIIEREHIVLQFFREYDMRTAAVTEHWGARMHHDDYPPNPRYHAPTPLVAAMRAYVALRFGAEISDS
ncbi:phage protein NinX family protein [Paraburkholderia caribensis]|uniref:phage protein NinX family protein n=1 Tax=Paraburkholderia caribensis TaxID=75105 RepID=UPI001D0924E2|nr:phage protein NinX family protein [Paraburkholderia caribensis]